MLSSPLAAAPPPSCAAPGGRGAELQLAWIMSGTGQEGGEGGEGGGGGVGGVGLVVYQVSNTEANELPGLSGLASRQRAVARIHSDRLPSSSPPLSPSSSSVSSSLLP